MEPTKFHTLPTWDGEKEIEVNKLILGSNNSTKHWSPQLLFLGSCVGTLKDWLSP